MSEQISNISDGYYNEALSFWRCGKIVQYSDMRYEDEQLLSSPIIYLYRHSAELLLKALIIRDATNLYIDDINLIKFPPHNRVLSSMHSLKALYETWTTVLSSMLVNPIDVDLNKKICTIIERVDNCDPISTFFRYPFDKQGNKNLKTFVTPVDDSDLIHLPCSIGAIIRHEGVDHFSRWYGNDEIAWLEIDLNILLSKLTFFYTGEELLQPVSNDEI